MLMNRRGVLGGLASMLAAPAIVHADNLMPVKALDNFGKSHRYVSCLLRDGTRVWWDYGSEVVMKRGDTFTLRPRGPVIVNDIAIGKIVFDAGALPIRSNGNLFSLQSAEPNGIQMR